MVKTKDYSQNNVGELIREVHLFYCFLNILALSGSCTCNLHLITIQKAQFKVYITKLLKKKKENVAVVSACLSAKIS